MKIYILMSLATIWLLPLVKSKCRSDDTGSKLNFWLTIGKGSDRSESVYTKWLTKYGNNAQEIFGAIWARLFDFTSSEMSRYGTVNGRLDAIKNARDELKKTCDDWTNFAQTWPYCSLAKQFTCKFYEAVKACYDAGNIGADKQMIASRLGPDTDARSAAINKLFHNNVIELLPKQTVESAFYSSGMVTQTYYKLYQYQRQPPALTTKTLNNWNNWGQVKKIVTDACTKHGQNPVGIQYYCKAKNIMEFFETCIDRDLPESCTFDPRFQHHWDTGTQLDYWRKSTTVPTIIARHTVEYFFSRVFSLFKNDDYNGLKKHIDLYRSYLNVEGKYCFQDWPRRVQCEDDQCEAFWMYRPDCTVKRIADAAKKYVDLRIAGKTLTDENVKDARDALTIWQLYPHVLEVVSVEAVPLTILTAMQKKISSVLQPHNIKNLVKYTTNIPPARFSTPGVEKNICSPVNPKYSSYCLLEPTISVIQDAADEMRGRERSIIKLNPQRKYVVELGQLQLETISNKINLQTKKLFDKLSTDLQNNFQALSTYFSSLAEFDKSKAEADIGFIQGRLKTFNTKVTDLTAKVTNTIKVIMIAAFVGTLAELAQRISEMVTAMVEAGNPGKWLAGGALGDILAAIDATVQAGVGVAKVSAIAGREIPATAREAQKLRENFSKNRIFLELTRKVIKGIAEGTNVENEVSTFLSRYNDYTPAVLKSDITSYGTNMETVFTDLCEALFEGGGAISGLAEIGIASSGHCVKVKSEVATLITVYEEMYDYENELMTSLAQAARAHLASKKAEDLKNVYNTKATDNQKFLEQYAVMTAALSTLHVWTIVNEYCNNLEYVNGGQMPDICKRTIVSPSFRNVAELSSFRPNKVCETNNEVRQYVAIPTKPKNKDDKTGYVDLQKLYAKTSLEFKITDAQHLLDLKWIDADHTKKSIYIKSFDLFLLPMEGSEKSLIKTHVTSSNQNKLQPSAKKSYLFETKTFKTRYYENSRNCFSKTIKNPYAICTESKAPDLCMTSSGKTQGVFNPSIYNTFKIRVVSLPVTAKTPNPKTPVQLFVGITLCFVGDDSTKRSVNLKEEMRSKRSVNLKEEMRSKRSVNLKEEMRSKSKITKRSSMSCCTKDQYLNGSGCAACPSGSVQKLYGYYCE